MSNAMHHDDHDHDHENHGHSHGHGHGHDHSKASESALKLALALTGTVLIAELIGGFWFHSLALLSDAMHMMTDAFALALALVAIRLARRAPDKKRTFGYARAEILAAAINAALLFAVGIYILCEAYQRLRSPAPVAIKGMLVIAIIGLVVNFIALRALAAGSKNSLNVKGAYLEVWADLLGSVAVFIAAVVMYYTGWLWVDPLLAALIGLWVLPRTWILLKDATNVLLEGAPADINIDEVAHAIRSIEGVSGVHDLHVWSLGSGKALMSAHVEISDAANAMALNAAVAGILAKRFGLAHSTLQMEVSRCAVVC
jgi:cobalt-zinc-cadmium efflux system protein